jgi:hypothetical protein
MVSKENYPPLFVVEKSDIKPSINYPLVIQTLNIVSPKISNSCQVFNPSVILGGPPNLDSSFQGWAICSSLRVLRERRSFSQVT